jgi:hypothetical protein
MIQKRHKTGEVTHDGWFYELVAQGADPGQYLLGVAYPGAQPSMEQLRFGKQVVESSREVGQTFLSCPGLPRTDRYFAISGVGVHRAVRDYPPPALWIPAGARDAGWRTG